MVVLNFGYILKIACDPETGMLGIKDKEASKRDSCFFINECKDSKKTKKGIFFPSMLSLGNIVLAVL